VPASAIDLGLLLDIDGPIASPVSRSIAIPSIIDDLIALTAAGVPIAFITGRSDTFVREQVIAPLLEAGLGHALHSPGARMFAVFEKGAAWATVGPSGLGTVEVDSSVAVPSDLVERVRVLHSARFSDTMFWDDTKLAMVSIEARVDVDAAVYRAAQHQMNAAAFDAAVELGYGIALGDRAVPDAEGAIPWRLDPTIISTDLESVTLDKDKGAERALDHFRSTGALPSIWRSVGDSRSDYKMADYVHSLGLEVAHVDVRPGDGVPEKPYRVITEGDLVHDHAGAAFLAFWRAKLSD
jgi:hypothetical protein